MTGTIMTTSTPPTTQRPARHPAAALRQPHVIAIASGKGGVGKTWLSVTLAHCFARQGQRVLLFDGDIGLANVDIQLGLMPDRDLGSVIAGRFSIAEAIMPSEAGFDIIAGKSGSASLATLDQAALTDLRDELMQVAKSYDRVIIDLGAGVDGVVRTFSAAAGITLVVTNDEPTALTDAYAYIKLARMADRNADVRVVVNIAPTTREGERTHAKLNKASENFLKYSPPLAGVIRRDDKVRDAIRNQVPLLTRHPMCEAAEDVEALAASLTRVPHAARL
ncbi:MAG TPA: MinD/ParA family protein [Ferrovibrio sp.]|uniref:MinD/ParA family protein n=1 Tax=Ferrovibrio sp. TaxID=1917215 RepID=UPI002B4AEE18|nr:MinD/ParA family protein [Ferrovibrio sp.]HLT76269.1 MinD/ParA family protein [Ferrovibrio sp.]